MTKVHFQRMHWMPIALLLLLTLGPVPAAAKDVKKGMKMDRTILVERINSLTKAMRTNDINTQLAFMPPRLVQAMAKQSNQSTIALKARMVKVMTPLLAKVQVESVEMNFKEMTVSAAGASRPFALLPTVIVMNLVDKAARYRKVTNYIAVMDDGKWYFDRVDNPAKFRTMSQLYPALAGLAKKIKTGSVKKLQ